MAEMAAAVTREHLAISVAVAELPAVQKCQFGGSLPHIRLPFRRKYAINVTTTATFTTFEASSPFKEMMNLQSTNKQ
jgi:hypothetical protein